MEEESVDVQESVNTEEVDDTLDHQEDEGASEQTDEVAEKLTKAEVLAKNQKIRAEKAEKELKRLKALQDNQKEAETAKIGSDYTLQDIRALSKVHDEDVERVEKFAKTEGLAIAEAMQDQDLKAILKNRSEMRETAQATNTGKTKRGSNAATHEQIVQAAQAGKEVDPQKLAEAELAMRRAQLKG